MANVLNFKDKAFSVGDTIRVYQSVKEGDKERTQMFEGILIKVSGRETGKSFTVRKIASAAVGVERIWPVLSPSLINITLKKSGKVRRAKLYYLRDRKGKLATKIKEKSKPVKKTSK